ncbi:ATP-binding protein [Paraburkholderia sp. BL10I2N1]|uniref:hybrid sensor histidine kinase/response regulator n=1 Tax=Paraburkholderia sp. BL10I2N1 TaxID=1938796 RepID=UPI0010EDE40C|nr:ATP-binding protein [Paraburkholderia sp. BL10I2N1]TDN70238.1 RsbRD-like negative regulator of sigma factor [Paraburkholderia sp. BL10I2N1]
MKARRPEPLRELPAYLQRKRGLVAQRWLAALRADPLSEARRLTAEQFIDDLPGIYEEICEKLKTARRRPVQARIERDARQRGRSRWMQGYQLDDLFRELDLLRRCVREATAEFFLLSPARSSKLEARAYQTIEDLFSATLHDAIGQLLEEQDQRAADLLRERDRALAAQQESEERLRMAAAATGLGIFEWRLAERSAVWENVWMYTITGQPPGDGPLSGEEFTQTVVHPDDASKLAEQFDEGKVPGRLVQAAFRIFRKSDRALRVVEMCGRFRFSDEGAVECFVGTLADITERTQVEDARKEADRRKDVFLATLAHELRSPLAPIRNGAQVMKDYLTSLPPQVQWVQAMIERQSRYLSDLVDDLLDVSRITTGKVKLKRKIFDLKEAAARAIEISQPLAEMRRQRLSVNLPDEAVFVNGDPMRLTQVMSNLLDNAIKYTGNGGDIRLTVQAECDTAMVSVEDTGIGIPTDELPHLFDLFLQVDPTTRRSRSGLGIGLSIVRSVVEMHGGDIAVTSAGPGQGSRFTVRLPIAPAPSGNESEPVAVEQGGGPKPQILIVDDNRDAADSLALILRMHDYEVRTADDGPGGIRVAAAWSPEVILLDIGLPGMNGHDVAKEFKALPQTQHAVLIAMTGFASAEDISKSAEAGFSRHLVKPVDPDMLIDLLRDMDSSRDGETGATAPSG